MKLTLLTLKFKKNDFFQVPMNVAVSGLGSTAERVQALQLYKTVLDSHYRV